MVARIRSAHDVAFGTYFLRPGRVADALIAAAKHGAGVTVTMQHDPYGGGADDDRPKLNEAVAERLRDAGARVTLLDRDATAFHAKAAVVDGVAYLDDRNWTASGHEVVIADSNAEDAALVRAAIDGHGGKDDALATRKDEALKREAQLLTSSLDAPAIVESETIGNGPLTHALRVRGDAGAPTTLIVRHAKHRSTAERKAIRALRDHGVRVLTNGSNEKLALVGGSAWIGSANGTGWHHTGKDGKSVSTGDQVEWGLVTHEAELVDAVRAALARDAAA